jgi:hypothetical protein
MSTDSLPRCWSLGQGDVDLVEGSVATVSWTARTSVAEGEGGRALSGLLPAARRLLTLPKTSNQNGAPSVIANPMRSHPATATVHPSTPLGRLDCSDGELKRLKFVECVNAVRVILLVRHLGHEALADTVGLPAGRQQSMCWR